MKEGGGERDRDPSGPLTTDMLLIPMHVAVHVNAFVHSGTKKFLENTTYNLFDFQVKKLVNRG